MIRHIVIPALLLAALAIGYDLLTDGPGRQMEHVQQTINTPEFQQELNARRAAWTR